MSNATVVTFSASAPSRLVWMPAAAAMLGCQIVAMSFGFTTALSSSTDTESRLTVPGGSCESVVVELSALFAERSVSVKF